MKIGSFKGFLAAFILFIALDTKAAPSRIITLSSAITETVDALGLGKNIVATDITSIYPAYANKLPKVSRNRSVSTEALLAFKPEVVLAQKGDVSVQIQQQLKKFGVKFFEFDQEYSPKGASNFIKQVANALDIAQKGAALAGAEEKSIARAIQAAKLRTKHTPKVLFIYARGVGTMSVAGKGSNIDAIIRLAGGKNAIQEFSDFKPYTTEALVKANPDVILMFDFGMSSLGGADAILKMPGVKLTNAGKSNRIVQMDGPLLINFGVRLDEAITQLNQKLVN